MNMKMMKRIVLIVVITLVVFLPAAKAQTNIVFDAMKDELARSMKELRLENAPAPYFISYLVNDSYNLIIAAQSGAQISSNSGSRTRLLRTDVRVGDYEWDNFNFRSSTVSGSDPSVLPDTVSIIIDDDYDALRRAMWRETDRMYMIAVDALNRKNTARKDMLQAADRPPDFSRGNATVSVAKANDFTISRELWEERVNHIAGLLLREKNIQNSMVQVQIRIANTLYVNSEGAETLEPSSYTMLLISAIVTADDGMPVERLRTYSAARHEELPDLKTLVTDTESLIAELNAAQNAPIGEDYSGPILFEGQAAAELFAQGFLNFLRGMRTPDAATPALATQLNQSANPFLNRMNARVASNFLSVKAVPSMKTYGGKELAGAHAVDSEGIPAQDVVLVENGMLRNLLMSRTPVKGFDASNGHGRGRQVVPSVIHVTSENRKSYDQLKQALIEAVKDEGLSYGYIIRRVMLTTGSTDGGGGVANILQSLLGQVQSEPGQFRLASGPFSIFRLYPDGKEEPVRGMELGAFNVSNMRDILATSDDETVHIFPAAGLGNAASIIIPSLLLKEVNLRKNVGVYPKPPVVDSPMKTEN